LESVSGSTEKISKTLGGAISNLSDNFELLLARLGSADSLFGSLISKTVNFASSILQDINALDKLLTTLDKLEVSLLEVFTKSGQELKNFIIAQEEYNKKTLESAETVEQLNKAIDIANSTIKDNTENIKLAIKFQKEQGEENEDSVRQWEIVNKQQVELVKNLKEKLKLLEKENKLIADQRVKRSKSINLTKKEIELRIQETAKTKKQLTEEEKRQKQQFELQKERLKLIEKAYDKEAELEKKRREKQIKEQEKAAKAAKDIIQDSTDFLNDQLEKRTELRLENTERAIEASQREEDRLLATAAAGNEFAADSARVERDRQRELERERQQIADKAFRRELLLAGVKLLTANAGSGAAASGITLSQISSFVSGVRQLPGFYEGTENTGDKGPMRDKHGVITGYTHKNERVINEAGNNELRGLSNDEVVEAGKMYKEGRFQYMIRTPRHNDGSTRDKVRHKETIKELRDIKKGIENIPEPVYYWDEIQDGISKRSRKGNKIINEHYKQKLI
jgi:hypothetical protein